MFLFIQCHKKSLFLFCDYCSIPSEWCDWLSSSPSICSINLLRLLLFSMVKLGNWNIPCVGTASTGAGELRVILKENHNVVIYWNVVFPGMLMTYKFKLNNISWNFQRICYFSISCSLHLKWAIFLSKIYVAVFFDSKGSIYMYFFFKMFMQKLIWNQFPWFLVYIFFFFFFLSFFKYKLIKSLISLITSYYEILSFCLFSLSYQVFTNYTNSALHSGGILIRYIYYSFLSEYFNDIIFYNAVSFYHVYLLLDLYRIMRMVSFLNFNLYDCVCDCFKCLNQENWDFFV